MIEMLISAVHPAVHSHRCRLQSRGGFCFCGGEGAAEEAALLSIAVVAAAGVAGMLAGLRYRVAALLAASAVAAAAGVARGVAGEWPGGTTALFALACVVALQLGYLVALFGRMALRRR